jgi:hypothetical protein
MGFRKTFQEGYRLFLKVGLFRGKGISKALIVGFAQFFAKNLNW